MNTNNLISIKNISTYRESLTLEEDIILNLNIYYFFIFVRMKKSSWKNSFDLVVKDLQYSPLFPVDTINAIRLTRNNKDLEKLISIEDTKEGFSSEKLFFKDNSLENYKEEAFNRLIKAIKIHDTDQINEIRNNLGLDDSYFKNGYDFYFNIILSYGLHKNLMRDYRKSNQLLLILPICIPSNNCIEDFYERLRGKLSKFFNLRLTKDKNNVNTLNLVIGDFDTLKIFSELDFVHFNNTLL